MNNQPTNSFRLLMLSRKRITVLLLIIVLSIVVPFMIGGKETIRYLSSIPIEAIAGLILLVIMRWILNAIRWQLMLKANGIHLKHHDTLTMLLSCLFVAELTPAGLGGPASGIILMRARRIPVATTAGIILINQCIDVLSILLLLIVALPMSAVFNTGDASWLIIAGVTLMLSALVTLFILIRYRRPLIRVIGRLPLSPRVNRKRRKILTRAWLKTGRATELMKTLPQPILAMITLCSIAMWLCRLSVIYMALTAIGHPIKWSDALLVQFVTGISAMLTGLPGGFIGAELTAAALLMPIVMDAKAVATTILIWRLMTYHLNLLTGGLSFLWQSFITIKLHENSPPDNPERECLQDKIVRST